MIGRRVARRKSGITWLHRPLVMDRKSPGDRINARAPAHPGPIGEDSEVHLEGGRPRDACASAERALQLSREREEPGHEAHALRTLGDANAARESPECQQAEGSYRQALAL